ncbi:GIY-YIG nuclease family protein [Pseudomonas putida]|uniref:GIY-YIG nuclease family protein n=1 Tax=Pseudomonas putida TaxID=303 RepID=UPI0022DE2C2B|nr:GIY-YIG nuclease family protein [Pseudomonas putida]WBM48177.1 GIY-YIG nuclease family protein [Pseudomonas putida]
MIYFFIEDTNESVKIGRAKVIERRRKALQTGNPRRLHLLGWIHTEDGEDVSLEKSLHDEFSHQRGSSEWFTSSRQMSCPYWNGTASMAAQTYRENRSKSLAMIGTVSLSIMGCGRGGIWSNTSAAHSAAASVECITRKPPPCTTAEL